MCYIDTRQEGRTKLLLKRGAWGPEHAVVDGEPLDMLDEVCSMLAALHLVHIRCPSIVGPPVLWTRGG